MTEMHDNPLDDLPVELRTTLGKLRQAYGEVAPPDAGPVVSAFMGVGLTNDKGDLSATAASNASEPAATQVVGLPNWRTRPTRRRQRTITAIGTFVGTAVGKVVLGTTIAAAGIGAGQATGIIDLPGLPGRGGDATQLEEPLDGGTSGVPDTGASHNAPVSTVAGDGFRHDAVTPGKQPSSTTTSQRQSAPHPAADADVDDDRPDETEPDPADATDVDDDGPEDTEGDTEMDNGGDESDDAEEPDEPEPDDPPDPTADIDKVGDRDEDRVEDMNDEEGGDAAAANDDDDRWVAPQGEPPAEDEPEEGNER